MILFKRLSSIALLCFFYCLFFHLSAMDNVSELEKLVAEGKEIDRALTYAQKNIRDGIWSNRFEAISLFNALFKQNRGFTEALDAAQETSMSDDAEIRLTALILFKILVEQGQTAAFDKAMNAAEKDIKSTNHKTHKPAIDLLLALFKNGYKLNQIVSIAQKNATSPEPHICIPALELFQALIQHGYAVNTEALDAAKKNMFSTDAHIRSAASNLFRDLIEKNLGLEEALDTIKKINAQEHKKMDTKHLDASRLLQFLVKKGHAYKEALAIAQEHAQKTDYFSQLSAHELFKALIQSFKKFNDNLEKLNELDSQINTGETDRIKIVRVLQELRALAEKQGWLSQPMDGLRKALELLKQKLMNLSQALGSMV